MLNLPNDLGAFIAYLAAPAFAAWVVSNFLESEAWFMALDSQGRSRVVTLVYVVLGVLSYLLLTTVPSTLITQLQPLYLAISAAIAAAVSGATYHAATKPDPVKVTSTSQSVSPDGTLTNKTTVEADVPQSKTDPIVTPTDVRITPPLGTPLPTVAEQAPSMSFVGTGARADSSTAPEGTVG